MFEPDNAAAVTDSQCTSEAMNIRNRSSKATHVKHSTAVTIDPDYALSSDERAAFRSILEEYDEVFDPNYTGYNGHVEPFKAVVNMGPVQPPQHKGRLPQYARNQLVELQKNSMKSRRWVCSSGLRTSQSMSSILTRRS